MDAKPYAKLATALKDLRYTAGLTQEELAEKLGCTKGAIANYESGTREPSKAMYTRLSEEFGITRADLIDIADGRKYLKISVPEYLQASTNVADYKNQLDRIKSYLNQFTKPTRTRNVSEYLAEYDDKAYETSGITLDEVIRFRRRIDEGEDIMIVLNDVFKFGYNGL